MSELKPCPFCGGEANIKNMDLHTRDGSIRAYWRVKCSKCQTEKGYTSIYCLRDDDTLFVAFDGRKRAIDAWNRRADDV